jgi:hypothetical protein
MEENETAVQAAKTDRTFGGFVSFVGRNAAKLLAVVSASPKLRALTAGGLSAALMALGMKVDGDTAFMVVSSVALAFWGTGQSGDAS